MPTLPARIIDFDDVDLNFLLLLPIPQNMKRHFSPLSSPLLSSRPSLQSLFMFSFKSFFMSSFSFSFFPVLFVFSCPLYHISLHPSFHDPFFFFMFFVFMSFLSFFFFMYPFSHLFSHLP